MKSEPLFRMETLVVEEHEVYTLPDRHVTLKDIEWWWKSVRCRLKSGFEHDFSTVPWFARWFIPKTGIASFTSRMHDGIYGANKDKATLQRLDSEGRWNAWRPKRLEADKMWREGFKERAKAVLDIMRAERDCLKGRQRLVKNVNIFYKKLSWFAQRTLGYVAIRAFGWMYWNT